MTRFVPGNCIELLRAGPEYFPALERAFDAAAHEIYLETYIYEDDETGKRVAAALTRAAARGVAVHLMIDGYGSKDLDRAFVTQLRAQGVRVLKFRPQISPWTLRRERLRRMHRKIAVVDGAVAFVGGINIIDDMHTPHHIPPRFDYAVRVQGPLVAEIHASVSRLWIVVSWLQFRKRAPPPRAAIGAAPCGTQRAAFLIRDNLRHRKDIENAYLLAISRARTEIMIANAYFFPGSTFRHALIDAARRGVRVVLLLQGRVEYLLLHYASRALYRHFLEAGIEIHEYHRSFLHAKVAVIDGRWSTVGSSNIDPMSLLLAREANVVIDDPKFAQDLRASLHEAMQTGCAQLERARWDTQTLSARVMTWTCFGLARLLIGWSAYGRSREFT
jgi:cardiolipin synthase